MVYKQFLWVFVIILSVEPVIAQNVTLSMPKVSSTERYQSLETLAKALYFVETMYVDPAQVKLPTLVNNALDGIMKNIDPHSVHLSPNSFKNLTSGTKGQIGGVGIIVRVEGTKLIIVTTLEGKPANKKGVKAGDEITAVNDVPVSKIGADILGMMSGEPGTKVKLTIKRKDQSKPLDFELVREIILVGSLRSEKLAEGLYYTSITNFQENTSQDLERFLVSTKGQLKGLILDLRDNPGGLLEEAVKVVDLFIESGLIVSTVGRNRDKIEREFAHKPNSYVGFPIILLVNEGSASASEIVAGALQDHKRALIMGSPSFGKGSVQTLIMLPDGSGLKLTIATYYTPNDRSIQAKGIEPDILLSKQTVVPNPEGRKEANLKGHLLSGDLSDFAKKSNFLNVSEKWPPSLKEDYQVVTAFTYLTGWSFFNGKSANAGKEDRTQPNTR